MGEILDDVAEALGEQARILTAERNLGLVPAINRGLHSSAADYAVILQPQVQVSPGWLDALLEVAHLPDVGVVSPVFRGSEQSFLPRPEPGCSRMETFTVSLAALMLKGDLQRSLGGFDESLDGGEWCLRDFLRRAGHAGYHCCVTATPELSSGKATLFGSPERRSESARLSRESYLSRWGVRRHYCIYFGREQGMDTIDAVMETILAGARCGHRYTLLLHHGQARQFRKLGLSGLHTGIALHSLPLIGAGRAVSRLAAAFRETDPDTVLVCSSAEPCFPGGAAAIPLNELGASGTDSLRVSSVFHNIHQEGP